MGENGSSGSLLPFTTSYTCLIIDACWKDFFKAATSCANPFSDSSKEIHALEKLWKTKDNPNPTLPCLSVRSAFDMYLRVMSFPEGSEVIMSAINIPSMLQIVKHHKLKPVPLDISLDTIAPKIDLLEHLITNKTRLILMAHIYGKWFSTDEYIDIAQRYNIPVIEDCAEAYYGLENVGNPRSDLCLFSFGSIKFNSSFGGCIAKIKDKDVYEKMKAVQKSYPVQSQYEYLKKVLKYSMLYLLLNKPHINYGLRLGIQVPLNISNETIQKNAISMLRGFPSDMMNKIRQQPCRPLLKTMVQRFTNYDKSETMLNNVKSEYVYSRLPQSLNQVGTKAAVKNYWLFPIIVENPDVLAKLLNQMGIDAYRGATQLNVIEPEPNGNPHLTPLKNFAIKYPHEAKFLIDHVIYLPINKLIPFYELDKICKVVREALLKCENEKLNGNGRMSIVTEPVKLKSKL